MAARPGGDAVDRLVQLCYSGLDVEALRRELLVRLRRVMTIDAAFFGTVDPATLLFTSAHPDAALAGATPGFLANELGGTDVNHFAVLAGTPGHVRSLDGATHGDRATSERYREVLAPLHLGDELRAALVCDGVCWGVICLHRDVRLLRRLGPHLAGGLRRGPGHRAARPGRGGRARARRPHGGRRRDGALAERRGRPLARRRRPAGRRAAGAGAGGGRAARPLRRQRRFAGARRPHRQRPVATVTASVMRGAGPPAVAVVPAPPEQVESVLLAAHGLTPAQRRVTELVLR